MKRIVITAAVILVAGGLLFLSLSATSSVAPATHAIELALGPDYPAVAREAAAIKCGGEATSAQVQEMLPRMETVTQEACAMRKQGVSDDKLVSSVGETALTAEQADRYVQAIVHYVCDRLK